MIPRIVKAEHVKDYRIHIGFSDGSEGEVNLERELEGEIFLPLRDKSYFKNFTVDQELHAVVWPNGADFAPEFLYEELRNPSYSHSA